MTDHRKNDIPFGFRENEVKKILELLLSGESCSIVGIGSVGKSNLFRFLLREDITQAYLGTKNKKYLFVYVDGNKKLENSDWGLFELIFHQLYLSITKFHLKDTVIQEIDDLYFRATTSISHSMRFLILRFLDRALSILIDQEGLNIVLMFDEFDSFCETVSPRAFSILRAMRDDHKYALMYLVATRVELTTLRKESIEVEVFYEIVKSNTITLLAYIKSDAIDMLNRLIARYAVALNKQAKDTILQLSGGHPALIKAIFDVLRENVSLKPSQIINNQRVIDECRRIWAGLSRQEQTSLVYVANIKKSAAIPREIQSILDRRGLLGGEWVKDNSIFSPVFGQFVLKEQPVVGSHIVVDRDHHAVWVNGQKFTGLPPLEFRFIEYLEQHRGQDCSRDKIAQYLYPDEILNKGEGVSDNRIDSIVKRVRKKIEANPDNPHYILTIRGFGFRLVDGNEEH